MRATKSKLPNEIKSMVLKHEKAEIKERAKATKEDRKVIKKVKEIK